jgi:predicted ATPase
MKLPLSYIRALLEEALTSEMLDAFSFDYFPQVYRQFTEGLSKGRRVLMLLTHADQARQLDKLLEAIKTVNPRVYNEFEARLPALSLQGRNLLQVATASYPQTYPHLDGLITESVNENSHHSEEAEAAVSIPAELDEFVGREHELDEIRSSLFVHPHLVSLTGIGGVGKSRLAKRFALQAEDRYGEHIWLIDLADILDPTQVIPKIAEVLGFLEHKRDRRPLINTIRYHLKSKGKDVLLVVDNCEHLLPGCARVIKQLREQCPNLHCLSTSQEPLGIPGERILPLQPFELLDPTKLPSIADVLNNKAIELFLRRAKRWGTAEIELTDQTANALAQVCWQVDGIPLAIELVAARLDEFNDIVELTAELTTSNCFKLLEDYSIKERPHHNKMWSTLNWSYQRLKRPERKLLDRLSVFMGGCSLEAVSKVCAGEIVAVMRIRALLRQLKLKSLIEYQHQQPTLRYSLLRLIRSFGLKHLKKSGEYMNMKHHHAQYYMELAEKAESKLRTNKQREWLARLESELDNFLAAIKYCYKQSRNGNKESTLIGLRIVGALSAFWLVRGYWQEGRALIKSMLTSSEGIVDPSRAKAMYGAGRLAWAQIDYKAAKELMEKSFRLYKRLGDKEGMARTLHELGNIERYRFAYDKVIRLYQEAQNLFKEVGDQTGIAWTIHDIGRVSRDKGDTRAAVKNFGLSLKMFQKLGDSRGIAHASHNIAHIERLQTKDKPRHYRKARELYHQCLKSFEVIGDKNGVAWALHHIGTIERYTHNYSKAVSYYESSLNEFQQIENTAGIAWTKRNMGKALLKQNNADLATKLCQESLKIFRDLKDTRGIAAAYSDLGDIAKEHHNNSEATKYYKQSLRLFQKLEDKNSANELSEKLTSLVRK